MEILRTIVLYTEGKDMPFLLIGGHAANAYGISRQTGDIDLLVARSCRSQWLELLKKLNYQSVQSDDRFSRFKPDTTAAWPIDLMYVDQATFAKLWTDSLLVDLGSASVKVVSARHLAILKLHALKHYQEHRFARDYADLLSLLKSGKTGISGKELEELCVRYASSELFPRLKGDLG